MERKFHVLTLNVTVWKKKNKYPESRKLLTMTVFSYMKDEIMATVEMFEKIFSREMKLFDQKVAMNSASEIVQRL